uniref:hypothetical protein n=1 Tax=Enterobacter sp. 214E4 TaxID=3077759 RepID=UPI002A822377
MEEKEQWFFSWNAYDATTWELLPAYSYGEVYSCCQQRVKSDPLTVTTNGLILIHLVYSGLASAITPAFRF